jgi:MYXO-CTERM domain-containing protein
MKVRHLIGALLCVAACGAISAAPVIPSLNLEDRTPAHNPAPPDRFLAGQLEWEWHQTVGTFSSADNRVGYSDFVSHDGADGGKRQVYTIGWEDRADEDIWAKYSASAPGPYTITLNGPSGFIGELHTTAYASNPCEGDVQNSSHHPYVGYRSAEMADLNPNSSPATTDQKYWLHFTSSTHDILGISIVGCNSWIPQGGNDVGATMGYYSGGPGGTHLGSFTNGVFFPNGYYDDNFMGYVDLAGVDTLLIDLSTGTVHDGEVRFDELAIVVQEKSSDDGGNVIPEPGAGALLLVGLLGAFRRRR